MTERLSTGSRGWRSPPRSRGLRVAIGVGVATLALFVPATPSVALVLFFQNFQSNVVVPYKMGTSGSLTQVGFAGTSPLVPSLTEGLAVRHQFTPTNDSQATVFAADFNRGVEPEGSVTAFTILSDGSLSRVPGTPIAAGGGPMAPEVSPDGRFLYVANHRGPPQPPSTTPLGMITAFRIGANGALTRIGSFQTNGNSPWGLSVSPHGVLYAPQENSGSVAAMRINTDGSLTHLTGSPYTIATPPPTPNSSAIDQLTDSDVSADGRFLFVTTGGSGPGQGFQGVWSFALNPDGTLASRTFIDRESSPIPIGVEVAPNDRHLYIVNRNDTSSAQGSGGVSGYAIASTGSLTRILGATSADAGTPFPTGGQAPHALDLVDRAPTFLFVGHGGPGGATNASFSVDDSSGLLTPVATRGSGGIGDAHFSSTSTTTNASSIVNRDRSLLRFLKTPNSGGYDVTIGGSTAFRTFSADKPRRVVPVPGSGCTPFETASTTGVRCTTANVTEVRVFTTDSDNRVRAQNGLRELVICGSGVDTVELDVLADPEPVNCDIVSRSAVGVGTPATPVGRSARVKNRVATLRLRCPESRQGNRCRGRVVIVPCPNNRPRARCKDRLVIRPARRGIGRADYRIRAGRREKVSVRLRGATRGRRKVRVLTVERDRKRRPMIGSSVLILKRR